MLVQNVVLALMFVLLKLFIRDNIRSSIYDNEFRLLQLGVAFFRVLLGAELLMKYKNRGYPKFNFETASIMYMEFRLLQASQSFFNSAH